MIRIGSLFSGIGGLELGIELALAEAGIASQVVWQVEQDAFCRSILARHWPRADRSIVDVRAASSIFLRPVDIIVGGFPCQDVSSAGLGEGLEGARSGLWYEYRRIVEELCPPLCVVENVASGKAKYLCPVQSGLQKLDYRTTALGIGAWEAGAPHRRERIFIVADAARIREREQADATIAIATGGRARDELGDRGQHDRTRTVVADAMRQRREEHAQLDRDAPQDPADRDPRRRHADGRGGSSRAMGDTDRARLEGRRGPESERADERPPRQAGASGRDDQDNGCAQPGLGGGAHGLPAGVDEHRWPAGRGEAQYEWEPPRTTSEGAMRPSRLKALGNAVVPHQAREVGRWMIAQGMI